MTTVLLASLFHETHCFVDHRTGLDQFRIRHGDQILQRAGDGSGVDGFLEVAAAADLPMRALEAAAREAEADPAILAMNIVAGFAFADQYDAGVAFCAVTDNSAVADAALERLGAIAWTYRDDGAPAEWDIDEVLRTHQPNGSGPTVLVQPADNIGG